MQDKLLESIKSDETANNNLVYTFKRIYHDNLEGSTEKIINNLRSRGFSDNWISRLSRSNHTMNQIILPLA